MHICYQIVSKNANNPRTCFCAVITRDSGDGGAKIENLSKNY